MENSLKYPGREENNVWALNRTGREVLTLTERLKEADRVAQIFSGNLAILSSVYLTTTLRSVKELEQEVYQLIEAFKYFQSDYQMYLPDINTSIPVSFDLAQQELQDILRQLVLLNPAIRELIEALNNDVSIPSTREGIDNSEPGFFSKALSAAETILTLIEIINTIGEIAGFNGNLGIVLSKILLSWAKPIAIAGGIFYGTMALATKYGEENPAFEELDNYSGYSQRIANIQEKNIGNSNFNHDQFIEITEFVRTISTDKNSYSRETVQGFVNELANEMEINVATGKDYLIKHDSDGYFMDTLVERFSAFQDRKKMEEFIGFREQKDPKKQGYAYSGENANPLYKKIIDSQSLDQQINLQQSFEHTITTKPSITVEVNVDGKHIPSTATILDTWEISEIVSNYDEVESIRYGKEAIRMG